MDGHRFTKNMLNILSLMLLLRATRVGSVAAFVPSHDPPAARPVVVAAVAAFGGGRLSRPVSSILSTSADDSAEDAEQVSDGPPHTASTALLHHWYGGDWAGLSATFSASTGELIRVPEHLVPESMVEWGRVPSCLEVLTSEEYQGEEGKDLGLVRQTVAVMPAVGCGVDNLDVLRTEELFDLLAKEGPRREAAVMGRRLPPLRDAERVKLETSFAVLPDDVEEETPENANDGGFSVAEGERGYLRRVRVVCNVVPSTRTVLSPITVVQERRTSTASSEGALGLGGGLDGRTVMRLVGKANANRPFAEREALGGVLEKEGCKTLSLPGDVVIRIGTAEGEAGGTDKSEWIVEVGMLDRPHEEYSYLQPEKRTLGVVRRVFGAGEDAAGSDNNAAEWTTEFLLEKVSRVKSDV